MGEAKRKELAAQELAVLAPMINEAYDAAKASMTTFLQHAMTCGDHLHKAKEKAGKNGWLKWLEENTKVPQTTASLYMRLATNRSTISNALANDPALSITKALELLPKAAPRGATKDTSLTAQAGAGTPTRTESKGEIKIPLKGSTDLVKAGGIDEIFKAMQKKDQVLKNMMVQASDTEIVDALVGLPPERFKKIASALTTAMAA